MKNASDKPATRNRAYTLIEALVASSVLLIGIGAASSMSLAMLTQEEINERSVTAVNYLDNALMLYQSGVDAADIPSILPAEPLVSSLNTATRNVNVPGLGSVPTVTLTLTYKPVNASSANSASIAIGPAAIPRLSEQSRSRPSAPAATSHLLSPG